MNKIFKLKSRGNKCVVVSEIASSKDKTKNTVVGSGFGISTICKSGYLACMLALVFATNANATNFQNGGAIAYGDKDVAIGENAIVGYVYEEQWYKVFNSIAIGYGAKAKSNSSLSIGQNAGDAFIGYSDKKFLLPSQDDIYIGFEAGKNYKYNPGRTDGDSVMKWGSIFLGERAGTNSDTAGAIMIGSDSGVNQTGYQNILIGDNAGIYDLNKFLTTHDSDFPRKAGERNVILGNQNITDSRFDKSYINDTVSVGTMARSSATQGIAIGSAFVEKSGSYSESRRNLKKSAAKDSLGAIVEGQRGIAIGASNANQKKTILKDNNEININVGARAFGDDSIALGTDTTTAGANSIVMGKNSRVEIKDQVISKNQKDLNSKLANSMVIGSDSNISSKNSAIFGNKNNITAQNSYAIGNNNEVTSNNTYVLGSNVEKTTENSLFLGNDSAYVEDGDTTKGTTKYTQDEIGNLNHKFSGGDNVVGVVSVGSQNQTRRIQNVAPGLISDKSTDAINGSQLYATNQILSKSLETLKNTLGGNANIDPNSGAINFTNIGGTDKNNINDAINVALSSGGKIHYVSISSTSKDAGSNYNNDGAKDGKDAIAIGLNAKSEASNSISIGKDAKNITSNTENSIAIGYEATNKNQRSIAIGEKSFTKGPYSISIGHKAVSSDHSSIAIGEGTNADGYTATAVGKKANAVNNFATAIGNKANADGYASTSVGNESSASKYGSAAIGANAKAQGKQSLALGAQTQAVDTNSTAIGYKASAKGKNSLAIGTNATVSGHSAVAIGENAKAEAGISIGKNAYSHNSNGGSEENNIAIGNDANASGNSSIAIGWQTKSEKAHTISIGYNAKTTKEHSMAVGENSKADGSQSSAFGSLAKAIGEYSTALGVRAHAQGDNSVAIGESSHAISEATVAIGYEAESEGKQSNAIGVNANAKGDYSNAIGAQASVKGKGSNAIGTWADAIGNYSTAIGYNSTAKEKGSLALGVASHAKVSDSIALGSRSIADVGAGEDGKYFGVGENDKKDTATWKSTLGAVSVGRAKGYKDKNGDALSEITRQITNVAAGTKDTDAVNVAQLKSLKSFADEGLTFAANEGTHKAALGTTVSVKGAAANTDWTKFDNGANIMTNIDTDGNIVVGLSKDLTNIKSITTENKGNLVINAGDETYTFDNGKNPDVKTNVVTNEKLTTKVTEAVGASKFAIKGDKNTEGKVTLSEGLSVVGDNSGITTKAENGKFTLSLDKDKVKDAAGTKDLADKLAAKADLNAGNLSNETGKVVNNTKETYADVWKEKLGIKGLNANQLFTAKADKSANGVTIGANGELKFFGDDNVIASSDANGIKYTLNKDLTNIKSITTENKGNLVINAGDETYTFDNGKNKGADTNVVTNKDLKEAVKQINTQVGSVNLNIAGDKSTKGSVNLKTETLNINGDGKNITTSVKNGEVKVALNDEINLGKDGEIKTRLGNDGLTITQVDGTKGPSITADGIAMNDKQITGLKSGLDGLLGQNGKDGTIADYKKLSDSEKEKYKHNAATIGDLATVDGKIVNVSTNINNIIGNTYITDDGNGNKTINVDKIKEDLATNSAYGQNKVVADGTGAIDMIVNSIKNINTQGTRFFHVNDGQDKGTGSLDKDDSSAYSKGGVAIGIQAKVDNYAENAISMGTKSQVSVAGGVALGSYSQANRKALDDITKKGVYLFDNQAVADTVANTKGAISVGGSDEVGNKFTRQITGVAAGTEDSDAVNVAQLKAVQKVANQGSKWIAADNRKFDKNGKIVDNNTPAEAKGVNSVAIGAGSNTKVISNGRVVERPNTVSVGGLNKDGTVTQRTISNVAPGVLDSDAATMGQLRAGLNDVYGKLGEYKKDASAGTASALAVGNLPQATIPGKGMVSLGSGFYDGESAMAIGLSKMSDSGKWVFKGSASYDSQEKAGAALSVGFHF